MAQSFLILDFGGNEDAAQAARRKIEAWKQGFRLGNKMVLKFDRRETSAQGEESDPSAPEKKLEKKPGKKSKLSASADSKKNGAGVSILLKLDFSDHEKLSHQRWLDRIPTEEPFSTASLDVIRSGDSTFAATSERFDALD